MYHTLYKYFFIISSEFYNLDTVVPILRMRTPRPREVFVTCLRSHRWITELKFTFKPTLTPKPSFHQPVASRGNILQNGTLDPQNKVPDPVKELPQLG